MKNIDEDGHKKPPTHLPPDMTSISTQPRYSQGDGHRAAVHDDGAKDPRLRWVRKGMAKADPQNNASIPWSVALL